MRCLPAATLPAAALPAVTLAMAIASVLGACAVAPSPPPVGSPSVSPAGTSPSASAGAPLLVAWEKRADGARLLVVHGGTTDRRPLPAVPNGPVAAGLHGPLFFLSGPPDRPVLWTSRGSLAEPQWDSQPLTPPAPQAEPLAWLCLGPGSPGRVAVQSNDNLVYVVQDGGRLALLPPALLMLRPGGCAWSDARHVIVPIDVPRPASHIGFAMFAVDARTSRVLAGTGGEAPDVSDVSMAYAARGTSGQLEVWIGTIPGPDDALPTPDVRVIPEHRDVDFLHPVLSADGRRVTVVELAPPAGPRRLLVYDVSADPTLVAQLDVTGAIDAGPVWVAD